MQLGEEDEKWEETYLETDKVFRPFSNYTEIILIATEKSRALNVISLFLYACTSLPVPHHHAPYVSPPPLPP